jgi:fumarate reductase flavoprotein subunit
MDTVRGDVAILGAGGMAASAIALAQAAPKAQGAAVSVTRCAATPAPRRRAAGGSVRRQPEHHFNDTVGGGDWLPDQTVDYFVREAPKELPS